jgi:hypothetical protein
MMFFNKLIGQVGNALRIKSAPTHTDAPAARAAEQPDAPDSGPADAPVAPTLDGE